MNLMDELTIMEWALLMGLLKEKERTNREALAKAQSSFVREHLLVEIKEINSVAGKLERHLIESRKVPVHE